MKLYEHDVNPTHVNLVDPHVVLKCAAMSSYNLSVQVNSSSCTSAQTQEGNLQKWFKSSMRGADTAYGKR